MVSSCNQRPIPVPLAIILVVTWRGEIINSYCFELRRDPTNAYPHNVKIRTLQWTIFLITQLVDQLTANYIQLVGKRKQAGNNAAWYNQTKR